MAEEEIKRAEEKLASTRKLRKKAMRLLWKCRATNSPSRNNKKHYTDKKQQELFLKFEQPQQKKRYEAKLDQATVEEQRTIPKIQYLSGIS